ncbi:hypothetical protein IC582_008090 [Cucumis melo]
MGKALDRPKSVSFASKCSSNRMLLGLISLELVGGYSHYVNILECFIYLFICIS